MTLKRWARLQAYRAAVHGPRRDVIWWLYVWLRGWIEGAEDTPVCYWQRHEA